jgi:hypothetical protein
MEDPELNKIAATDAKQMIEDLAIELDEEAAVLVEDGQSPADLLRSLLDHDQILDAIGFLAHALPTREAVWWACLCARKMPGGVTGEHAARALEAAEAWVKQPDEDNRRAAEVAAEAADMEGPASFAAMAAFMSGGSIAPAEFDTVEPPENITARLVAGAVIVAVHNFEPGEIDEKSRAFVNEGMELAIGQNHSAET